MWINDDMSVRQNIGFTGILLMLGLLSGFGAFLPMRTSAQSVTLGWQASTDTNVVGYNIYYGITSGDYTNEVTLGNVTIATLSGLTEGTTYYLAATTYDAQNDQSSLSPEISYTVPITETNQPPMITSLTSTNTAIAGQGVTFSITAAGTGPLTYQWIWDSNNIAAGTNAVLTLTNATPAQTGQYYVIVSNSTGSTNSSIINLTIYPTVAATLFPAFFVVGHFAIDISGISNYLYVVQASTNLVDWVSVETNISPFTFVDFNTSGFEQRYYRAYYTVNPPANQPNNFTNGLVAWYPLAGEISDYSGNGNDGMGIGTLTYTSGPLSVADTALGFDGVDNYVYANNVSELITNSTAISITGWIHPNDANADYGCFGFRAPADGPGAFYINTLSTGNYEARFRNSSGGAVTINAPFTTGKWTFVALTYDGSTLTIYTNGVAAASAPASGYFGVGNLPFYIGGTGYTPTGSLPDFPMAGIRLYNSVISPSTIGQLYTNGIDNGVF